MKYRHISIDSRKIPNWFENLIELIGFFFAVMASQLLAANPFFGASLYIGGQLMLLYADIFTKGGKYILPAGERKKYFFFMPFVVVILLCMLIGYPLLKKNRETLLVIVFISVLFIVLHSVTLSFMRGTALSRRRDLSVGTNRSEPELAPGEISEMMNVRSYKLYWYMTANIRVAFEMSLLFAICYIQYLPFRGYWPLLTDILVFAAVYSLASAISRLILRKRPLRELGKNTVFIIFSVIWITVNYYFHQHYGQLSSIRIDILYVILGVSITALASVAISMESDMQIISSLGIKDFTPRKYEILKALLDHLSTFYSRFAILVMISVLAFFNELNPDKSSGTVYVMGKYGFTLIPAVFVAFGVLAAIKQPFTRLYEEKLKKYFVLISEGISNPSLEKRLRSVLVDKYRKRLGIRLLMFLLKPLFHHRVIGRENVATADFPSIFVCNHSQIYGPIAAILNMPFYAKPWILNEMVDNEKIAAHIQQGTFDRQKWIPKFLRNRMGRLFGPVIAWAMQSAEPIPVQRKEGKDMLQVISMSVEALEADDNILIFPENPFSTGGYVVEGVGEFFSGFVNIARDYYRRTGKAVTFYSVFANKKKRTLSFSKGIPFEPSAPFHEEKEHITRLLHDEMLRMSE